MSRRGLHLFIALLAFAGAAWGQGSGTMLVDLSTLPANLESGFTLRRTGQGAAPGCRSGKREPHCYETIP